MRIAVIGAGGFARELKWLIDELDHEFAGFYVSDVSRLGDLDSRDEVRGDLDVLGSSQDVDGLAIGIGNPTVRLRIGRDLAARMPQLEWPALVHPFASAIDTELPVPPERTHLMLASKASWVEVHAGAHDQTFDHYPKESLAEWHARLGLEDPS